MRRSQSLLAIILSFSLLVPHIIAQKSQDVTAEFSWNRMAPPPESPPPSQTPGAGGSPTQAQAPQAQPGPAKGGQQPVGGPAPAGGNAPPIPPQGLPKTGPAVAGNAPGNPPPQGNTPGNASQTISQNSGKGNPKGKSGNPNSAGYDGYSLTQTGDPNSVHYETNQTNTDNNSTGLNITLPKEPDVYLNASVHVGLISLEVLNITAKINLDAQVKGLLTFNAGINAHIDRVRLVIEGVEARVLLEARLENLVKIISDVLDSLDLNPIIATLANDINKVVNTTLGQLTGPAPKMRDIQARSVRIEHNILYSVNDYTGSTHTNRILEQNGEIVDEFLDNQGIRHGSNLVGYYSRDMVWNGINKTMTRNGEIVSELEYVYDPFPGLTVISAVFLNQGGRVVATQVISEAFGGGMSTVEPRVFKRRV